MFNIDVNNDRKRKEELQLTPIMTQDMELYFRKLGTFETAEVAEVAMFMRTVAIHYRKYHDDLLENLPSRLSGLKTILKNRYNLFKGAFRNYNCSKVSKQQDDCIGCRNCKNNVCSSLCSRCWMLTACDDCAKKTGCMECFAPYSSCIKVLFKNTQPRSVNKKKEKDLLNDYLGAQTWLEFMADKLEEDNSLLKDCLRALEAGF